MILRALLPAMAAACLLAAGPAGATQYTFVQDGFTATLPDSSVITGQVTGSFEGEDLNTNGYIEGGFFFGGGEVSAFSATFTSGALTQAYILDDLAGLVYDLDGFITAEQIGPGFNETEGLLLLALNFNDWAVGGPVGGPTACTSGNDCGIVYYDDLIFTTTQPVVVTEAGPTAVSEPGTFALAGLGLLGLVAVARRRR